MNDMHVGDVVIYAWNREREWMGVEVGIVTKVRERQFGFNDTKVKFLNKPFGIFYWREQSWNDHNMLMKVDEVVRRHILCQTGKEIEFFVEELKKKNNKKQMDKICKEYYGSFLEHISKELTMEGKE